MLPRFSKDAGAWLVAAAFIGVGQQVFVVLRNQYLAALAFSPQSIALVQGAGGVAGIVAGLLGLSALRHVSSRTVLGLGVIANAVGFAVQLQSREVWTLVAGAALAGLGIQWLTMSAAPFLVRNSLPEDRVRLFAFNAIVIQSLPGAVGAWLGGRTQQSIAARTGSSIAGYQWALGAGVVAVLVALAPLSRIEGKPTASNGSLGRPRGRAHWLLVPDALIFFGNGLTTPFFQLYFSARFGLTPASIGSAYAIMMLMGALAHLASPWLARRFGVGGIVVGSQVLSLPLFAGLLLASSPPLALVSFVLRQAVLNVSLPQYSNWIHSTVPPQQSDSVAASRMLVQSVAWASANFVAGPLLAWRADFSAVIGATMIVQLLAIVMTGFVLKRAANLLHTAW